MTESGHGSPIGPGTTVRHYTIVKSLGRGGMGEVFLAHDGRLDRNVAVKVLSADLASDETWLKRFEQEARILAALNHPNIVSIFAIEEAAQHHLLVMELIEGRTMRDLVGPRGMALDRFFEIAIDLTDALAAAHERGVLHRDLKPENVMVTPSGRVKILDFGIAKFRPNASGMTGETVTKRSLTGDGMVVGTLAYMSPEQAEDETVDHRSDIFALGVVFQEMLTGSRPFHGRTLSQFLTALLHEDAPPVTASRTDVPAALSEVVKRCLQKAPGARYQSAHELHQHLKSLWQKLTRSGETTASVDTVSGTPGPAERVGVPWLIGTRWGLSVLLGILWTVNWIETSAEAAWSSRASAGWLGYDMARAFSWVEGSLSFERHDLAGSAAVYGGSIAYFFLPLFMLAVTLAALIPRRSLEAYRTLVLAITVCYGVSLVFYLLLPVPERWAFPDSQATLLSDVWSARLIETVRHVSGIDNCCPSFHVSGTFALVLVWFLFRLRYRWSMAFLGGAVAVSTLLIGIHWVADIAAGFALAMTSVRIADRISAAWTASAGAAV